MIDIIKQTPEIYSQDSRDYQVLARLYTALFNLNKMYIDNLSVWNKDIDNKLTMLRSKTLNFVPRHEWDKDSLESIVSCFKYLMRNKGTINALEYCVRILLRINNLTGIPAVTQKGNMVIIKLPTYLSSLGIIDDLVSYLLPAGFTYRIYTYKTYDTNTSTSILYDLDKYSLASILNKDMGIYNGTAEGTWDYSSEGNQGYTWYRNTVNTKGSVLDDLV